MNFPICATFSIMLQLIIALRNGQHSDTNTLIFNICSEISMILANNFIHICSKKQVKKVRVLRAGWIL